MNKLKTKLLLVIAAAMVILTACSEAESSFQEERIEKIKVEYQNVLIGRYPVLMVSTQIQTYVMFTSNLLNNFSEEDRLISVDDKRYLELTPESYKLLSEQYTDVTGSTLSHKNTTIEDYLE